VENFAWVIMPDHMRWLLAPKDDCLEHIMQCLKSKSAIAINRYTGSSGRVWQQGYYDHALRSDEDVKAIARYVIANPLRAGLVARLGDYPLWDAEWL
jgi:REP element-mobilizing transposase RayT